MHEGKKVCITVVFKYLQVVQHGWTKGHYLMVGEEVRHGEVEATRVVVRGQTMKGFEY